MNTQPRQRADLHVHSTRSYDVHEIGICEPRALYERALGHPDPARRMTLFALTDHFTMAGYDDLRRSLSAGERRLLIPGVEHALLDPEIGFSVHVNLYLLSPDQYAEIQRRIRTLSELRAYCAENGIYVQYNHPTWWERAEFRNGQVKVWKVPQVASYFQVLEKNAGRTDLMNLVTEGLARLTGKHLTGGSDTHTGDVGKAYTEAPGANVEEFLASIWNGRGRAHVPSITYRRLLEMVHAVIDELLDARQGVQLKRSAMASGHPILESVADQIFRSDRLMRTSVLRESFRRVLKGISKPVVRGWIHYERQLEKMLLESDLARFLEPQPVPVPVRRR